VQFRKVALLINLTRHRHKTLGDKSYRIKGLLVNPIALGSVTGCDENFESWMDLYSGVCNAGMELFLMLARTWDRRWSKSSP